MKKHTKPLIIAGAAIGGLTIIIGSILILICTGTISLPFSKTTITGGVYGHDGIKAVANATVTLDTGSVAQTDAKGTFLFTDVPTGTRTIAIEAPLYEPAKQEITLTSAEHEPIEVELELTGPDDNSLILAQYLAHGMGGNVALFTSEGQMVAQIPDAANATFGEDGKTITFEFKESRYRVFLDGSGRERIGAVTESDRLSTETGTPENQLTSADGNYTLTADERELFVTEVRSADDTLVYTFPEQSSATWAGTSNTVLFSYFASSALKTKYKMISLPDTPPDTEIPTDQAEELPYEHSSISFKYLTWNHDGTAFIANDTLFTLNGDDYELPYSGAVFLPDNRLLLSVFDSAAPGYDKGTYLLSETGELEEQLSTERMELDEIVWSSDGTQAILTNDFALFLLEPGEPAITRLTPDTNNQVRFNKASWYQQP